MSYKNADTVTFNKKITTSDVATQSYISHAITCNVHYLLRICVVERVLTHKFLCKNSRRYSHRVCMKVEKIFGAVQCCYVPLYTKLLFNHANLSLWTLVWTFWHWI